MLNPGPNPGQAKPLKVAHIAVSLDMGGLERMLIDFATFTDKAAFETIFFSLTTRGVVAELLESLGYPVRIVGKAPGISPAAVLRLAGMLRASGVDIVHTHNNTALLYGAPAAKLAGIRYLIHTRHGNETESRAIDFVLRQIARMVDRLICVSDDTASVARRERMPERAIRTILNGIDLDKFRPVVPDCDGPAVTVARLSIEKDIATLIKAIGIARQQGSDIPLEVVGDGPMREALEQDAKTLGVSDLVTFRGQITGVSEILARSSVFVLPSTAEGLSLAVLEAMAVGLPVIATDVGGNPEAVESGVTGAIVPPRDPERLAAALMAIRSDHDGLRRMGKAGRARVEALFDVRKTMAAYGRLYRGEGV